MKQDYHQALLPDITYHLFSRAIGSEKLFASNENYRFFLRKLEQHTSPIAELLCYSLLPNHFHLLVRIKSKAEIIEIFNLVKKRNFVDLEHCLSDFIMERFSNFLNSYTKSYNKMYSRKGALFLDYIKRSKALDDAAFTYFVFYIHKNAVHHGLTKQIGEWKYDSYNTFLHAANKDILITKVLDWFGGLPEFIEFHRQKVDLKLNILDI